MTPIRFSKTVTATFLFSVASTPAYADQRIAVFDFGSLDTLDALGASEQVVAVPKQSLPAYLASYADERYTDIGGLRSPDLDSLRNSMPDLVIYTGRQGDWEEALGDIAPLLNASLQGDDDYLTAFDANVRELANRSEREAQAEDALETLHNEIETQRQALNNAPKTLVVTYNDGNLMLNQHPVVHQVLGITTLEMPSSVNSETRGNRSFTPLSPESIAEIAPDIMLVIDRSAAIGNESADTDNLRQALTDAGANTQIIMLTPDLWYLSGGGLQSLSLQIDEVSSALSSAL